MRILEGRAADNYVRKLEQRAQRLDALEPRVRRMVQRVRQDGDKALRRYAEQWDGLGAGDALRVPEREMQAALRASSRELRSALETAAGNIRNFCEWQKPAEWAREKQGRKLSQLIRPLTSVGCYVPGGRYPLPSTVLMTAIPARVAGVKEVIAVCPKPDAVVMAAALEAGVSRFFRIGGAQAIAALAYGTASVPRVDKIVGPGNRYVAAAKAQIAADCGIDFYAGPTEIVIVATRGPAEWIAADLIAQAEHDPDARAVLITTSRALANKVGAAVDAAMPPTGPAAESLRAHGGIIVTRSKSEAIALANDAAAEHLVVDDDSMAAKVRCAGSLFVGAWSAQVAGDYAIGSNHVLPTAGAARVRGGLSAADFVRQITVQRLTQKGLEQIGPAVIDLATAEGLLAHAESIAVRLRKH